VTKFRRGDELSLEEEREALRRQRAEGAAELERLKRTLAERVEFVRMRERELEDALTRARGQPEPGARSPFRLPQAVGADVLAQHRRALDARAADLARREAALAAREQALGAVTPEELAERERVVAEREADLERRLAEFQAQDPVEREARIDERLAELEAAELQFVKTHAELAARSDRLAEREQELAARERALPGGNGGDTSDRLSIVDVEALEARLRRLEQSGTRQGTTFSSGLRAMQERSARRRSGPEAPLH
jgi:hypothetical protein